MNYIKPSIFKIIKNPFKRWLSERTRTFELEIDLEFLTNRLFYINAERDNYGN